jgi:hypothetical protein
MVKVIISLEMLLLVNIVRGTNKYVLSFVYESLRSLGLSFLQLKVNRAMLLVLISCDLEAFPLTSNRIMLQTLTSVLNQDVLGCRVSIS